MTQNRYNRICGVERQILFSNESISFGGWLKKRRKELGLTQGQLAQASSCATITIRKMEADSRKPSHQIAQQLLAPLEIAVSNTAAFLRFALADPPKASSRLVASPEKEASNLIVPLTPLLGREGEVEKIIQWLRRDEIRLLTLYGPAGTGKTRLALHIANQMLPDFTGGVFFVALAAVREPTAVLTAMVKTLGVTESGYQALIEDLKAFLQPKPMLVVLDNFEQVVAAAPLVVEILQACPRLKILVTSRIVLHVRGEHEFPIPTLALPQLANALLEDLTQNPAIALFVARTQAVKPDFVLTQENAPTIAEICIRLDGLPLAIELAATHSKILSPPQLLARLENRLDLLSKGAQDLPLRHQSLRHALDWSYNLLNCQEQILFRRLGVFVSSCNPVAVGQICEPEIENAFEVLYHLETLIDKSLLQPVPGQTEQPRFRMLEVIREYAAEQMSEGETALINQRYVDYYLDLAETAQQKLHGPAQIEWLDKLEQELDNLRIALSILLEQQQIETALHFSGCLGQFWFIRGYLGEGRQWLEKVLALATAHPPTPALGQVVNALGLLVWAGADYTLAYAHGTRAVKLLRELTDKDGLGQALITSGLAAAGLNDTKAACEYFEESVALSDEINSDWAIARALNYLGYVLGVQGNYPAAKIKLKESLALFRVAGDKHSLAGTLNNLGCVLLELGETARVRLLLEESLMLFDQVGDKRQRAWTLNSLGELNRYEGNYVEAEEFYHESLNIFRQMDQKPRVAQVLHNLGHIALHQENYPQATAFFRESLELRQKTVSAPATVSLGIVECLAGLGGVVSHAGQPEVGARIFGLVAVLLKANKLQLEKTDCIEYQGNLAFTRSHLDLASWTKEWLQGQELSLEQTLASPFRS